MSDENTQPHNANPQSEQNPRVVSVRPMVSEQAETRGGTGLIKGIKPGNSLTASEPQDLEKRSL